MDTFLMQVYAFIAIIENDLFGSEHDESERIKSVIQEHFKSQGWEVNYSDLAGWGIFPIKQEKKDINE